MKKGEMKPDRKYKYLTVRLSFKDQDFFEFLMENTGLNKSELVRSWLYERKSEYEEFNRSNRV